MGGLFGWEDVKMDGWIVNGWVGGCQMDRGRREADRGGYLGD